LFRGGCLLSGFWFLAGIRLFSFNRVSEVRGNSERAGSDLDGSGPHAGAKCKQGSNSADVIVRKDLVVGSIPTSSTKFLNQLSAVIVLVIPQLQPVVVPVTVTGLLPAPRSTSAWEILIVFLRNLLSAIASAASVVKRREWRI